MKKLLLSTLTFLLISLSYGADFGIWASAIRLNVNGSSAFYNTKYLSGPAAIGDTNLTGFLGVFGNHTGTLIIEGAEIKTFKETGSNICGATLYYAIYRVGSRPEFPAFKSVNLSAYCNCINNSFSNCDAGPCNSSTNDHIWQKVNQNIDLTTYPIGNYTIEVYYQLKGETATTGCSQYRSDNNEGLNYTAEFAIAAPLAINFTALNGTGTTNSVKVRWGIANDVEVQKYEIQKSDNGLNFEPIGNITANRTGTICNYVFDDKTPIIGSNYYRIKIINLNNTVSLSKVLRIYFGQVGNTIFIYPNPSGNELAVRFAAVKKGNYQMGVFNSDGQKIATMPAIHDGNDKTMRMQLPHTIAHGVYWLFLIDKVQFYKQSFIVR